MTGTKGRIVKQEEEKRLYKEERARQKKEWEDEKQRRQDERQQRMDEQKKKDEARRKRDEEHWKQEEDMQKEWEADMIRKLDYHPYSDEIELCESLLRYCKKNLPKEEQDENKDVE